MGAEGGPPHDAVWRALVEGTQAGVALLDTGLRYVYVNPALARMNGVSAAGHVGRLVAEVVPQVQGNEELMRQVLADGRPREGDSSGQTRARSDHVRRYWRKSRHMRKRLRLK